MFFTRSGDVNEYLFPNRFIHSDNYADGLVNQSIGPTFISPLYDTKLLAELTRYSFSIILTIFFLNLCQSFS